MRKFLSLVEELFSWKDVSNKGICQNICLDLRLYFKIFFCYLYPAISYESKMIQDDLDSNIIGKETKEAKILFFFSFKHFILLERRQVQIDHTSDDSTVSFVSIFLGGSHADSHGNYSALVHHLLMEVAYFYTQIH